MQKVVKEIEKEQKRKLDAAPPGEQGDGEREYAVEKELLQRPST